MIRPSNPTRAVIIGPVDWNNIGGRPAAGQYIREKSGNWTDLKGRPVDGGS